LGCASSRPAETDNVRIKLVKMLAQMLQNVASLVGLDAPLLVQEEAFTLGLKIAECHPRLGRHGCR
jgi:hypothetical protein